MFLLFSTDTSTPGSFKTVFGDLWKKDDLGKRDAENKLFLVRSRFLWNGLFKRYNYNAAISYVKKPESNLENAQNVFGSYQVRDKSEQKD